MKKIMKKDEGFIQYALCIMLISICALIMLYTLRMRIVQEQKMYIEDALVSANLAAAVIDTDVYGETEKLIITDELRAYERFQNALKTNLNLDDDYTPRNTFLMENAVKVLEFHIYNVDEYTVTHIVFDEYGSKRTEVMGLSGAATPDGTDVESTTIYSKIEFDVKGFLTQRNRMTLEKSVDIVKN